MTVSWAPQAAPRSNPDLYPGAWPQDSCVVTFDEVIPMAGIPEHAVPVLAVGSNASPAQLRHKFLDSPDLLWMPMSRAQVIGVTVAYVPWQIWYGACPATALVDPTSELDLMVQWIAPEQMEVLDESETGYTRTWLTPEDGVEVRVDGELLEGVYAYVADSGPLVLDGHVVRMLTPWQVAAGVQPTSHAVATQAELRELLAQASDVGEAASPAETTLEQPAVSDDQPLQQHVFPPSL